MTRPGVPPYDGKCAVCSRKGFRDALQYVNHVSFIHQDEADKVGVERETLKALAHYLLGPEAEDKASLKPATSTDGTTVMSCPLCNVFGEDDLPTLVQHGRKSHSDLFDRFVAEIQLELDILEPDDIPAAKKATGTEVEKESSSGAEAGGSPSAKSRSRDQSVTVQLTESAPVDGSKGETRSQAADIDLDDVLGETEASERREQLAEDILMLFLDRFAIDYEQDEHGVVHAELPRRSGVSGTVEWLVAFDKEVAKNRHVDFINYTNPEFQRILRYIQSDPILAIRLVQEPENPTTLSDESSYNVLRTEFSFHIEYRTYGESREELVRMSVGEEELGEVLTIDAFQPEPFPLPGTVRDHYESAKERLADHLSDRAAVFAEHARERRETEEETLEQFEHKQIPDKHGYKQIKEDEEFYRSAIERYQESLDAKYEVVTEVQLLTVEPYLAVGE